MMKDLNSVDQFRTIQKNEFLTRNPFEDNDIMTGEVDHFKTEEERNLIKQKFFTLHQKAYIKNCKENRALPLPLLKKIKFDVFVLKNYQISHAVAESFGASMHHLSEYLKGIILSNNNMRDNEILLILQGMRFNPIRSLVIENNKLGPLSMKELWDLVSVDEETPKVNGKRINTRLHLLELDKCDITQTLMNRFIEILTENNREIENLKLSSFVFSKPMSINLSRFVRENYSLKKLNLSWSEMMSENLMVFMENIQDIKHLQDLDISKIPIEGKDRIRVVEMIKEYIINDNSLIHLNMSCCNLLQDQLEILTAGIKKSKSLLSVHLSGNCISQDLQVKIIETLTKPTGSKDKFFETDGEDECDSPRTVLSMVTNRFDKKKLQ